MRSGRTSRALFAPYVVAAAAAIAFVPVFPGDASAAGSAAQRDRTKAQDLFKKSADAYRKGDFKTAVDLLNQAYALDPQPVLVYNLARAHEGLGNTDEAIEAYEKYLAQEPKAPDRGAIEQRLATLKRQRDERIAARKRPTPPVAPSVAPSSTPAPASSESAPPKPPPAPPTEPPPPRAPSKVPYILGGAGVVGLGLGTAFGLMASSHESDGNAAPVQQTAIDERDSGKSLATVANVSFVVGGVLLAAGVTWFVIDRTSRKKTTTALALGPGYVGVGGGF